VSALRRPGLVPLLIAETISTTGSAMTALALPWLVLVATGSPGKASLVAAAEWVPMAVLGIPSGPLAARLGPRRTMIVCDLARAPIVAAVPILHWLGALPFGALIPIAAALGTFFPAHYASQRTILPQLLGDGAVEVTRGNVLLQAANRLPLVLGPAIAGVLIAAIGAPGVLLVDAASYTVSAGLLILLVPKTPAPAVAEEADSGGVWAGARELTRDRVLAGLTVVFAVFEFAMQVLFLALPILAFTVYDREPGLAGALLAAWGAGALGGTLIALRVSDREPVRLVRGALLAQAAPLWLLGLDVPPAALAAALLVSGLANPLANAPSMTLITLQVREVVRAKTMLAFLTACTLAGGLGLLVTGPAAEALGARELLLGVAALTSAGALGFALATRRRPPGSVRLALPDGDGVVHRRDGEQAPDRGARVRDHQRPRLRLRPMARLEDGAQPGRVDESECRELQVEHGRMPLLGEGERGLELRDGRDVELARDHEP
jgi:predicted MFS family arabinose efflux permease